jgi:hypothetical protein
MVRPLPRLLLVFVGVASVVVPGACSADTAADAPTADATTIPTPAPADPTTSTAAPPTPEQQVEAAYVAIMARYFEQLADPDPVEEHFKGHFGAHNQFVVEMHRQFASENVIASPGPTGRWPAPKVIETSVTGESARLTVCLVDDSRVLDIASGQIVNADISSKLSTATLTRIEGSWTLTNQKLLRQWPDAEGCDR